MGGQSPPGVPGPAAEWRERPPAGITGVSVSVTLYRILSFSFYARLPHPSSGPAFYSSGPAFYAAFRVFRPVGEGLLVDPGPGSAVSPGLSAHLIAFGGYTGYDYVPHGGGGRTLGKKAMKIRLVPYDGVAPRAAGPMKRAALRPGVLITAGIPW
ncbi:hypothetical protein [Streptosporangium minutum]|uniref:hypothetical protein n=1 Tax=Streptosporangium minutum TaxID=569862 RepID=UPI0010567E26|nr:hypothetical protein [Streptosporangium minutum]